jgi:indolepyruvate ferredoxin oxidoreductase, alpha subunit
LKKTSKKQALLTGNEAIARGAYEAGVKVASAYPGTPSTEILENIAKYEQIYSQWSVNEKVALEVGSGSSIAGARTLVAMKHVGLNVASDPFMTLSYTGVNGGLVIISADDPNMHSSQNEQDNRYYAMMAHIPMLEPSDSAEAKEFVKAAFEISERFDTPVLVRTTTRINHSRSMVGLEDRIEVGLKEYKKDPLKYVMIPAYARLRHKVILDRSIKLKEFSESCSFNFTVHDHPSDIGIITSGVSYQYAREVFDDMPILKLSLTYPLSTEKIKEFAKNKKTVIVIEELEPYIEDALRSLCLGVKIIGKDFFPLNGELGVEIVKELKTRLDADGKKADSKKLPQTGKPAVTSSTEGLLPRPPILCAGCSHRPVFHIIKKMKLMVMGDIGCYTLSTLEPLNCLDSCLCMGGGVSQALGVEKADPSLCGKVVSVIGDSTFFHSGITSLIDHVFNRSKGTVLILDNRITAMTGHQSHPGVGVTLKKEQTQEIKPEDIAKSLGIKNIAVVDAYDVAEIERVLKAEIKREELSVIIFRQSCVLAVKKGEKTAIVDQETCKKCGICIKFGCPAIEKKGECYSINRLLCNGCRVCMDICPKKCISVMDY